jgi:hypothetical protein
MFIVIEKSVGWEYASIVTNNEGMVQVFSDFDNAKEEAKCCQNGIVIGEDTDGNLIIKAN